MKKWQSVSIFAIYIGIFGVFIFSVGHHRFVFQVDAATINKKVVQVKQETQTPNNKGVATIKKATVKEKVKLLPPKKKVPSKQQEKGSLNTSADGASQNKQTKPSNLVAAIPIVDNTPRAQPANIPWQTLSQNEQQQTIQKPDVVEFFTVTRVVDGDTFDIAINGKTERIRAIGIDTPEIVDPRKPVQCFGKEASQKTTELLLGKKVRLEADPTQGEYDKYYRLLRYVYRDDGLFFNKAIIEQGFAYEYTYVIPYKYQSDFKAAQTTAREKQLGLWTPDACISPPLPQQGQNSTNTNTPTPQTGTQGSAQPHQSTNQGGTSIQTDGHTWYTSSYHTARFYYCDTDEQWKGLSSKYLQTFSSEAELLNKYQRTLHESCK